MVEHFPDKKEVSGPIPDSPTNFQVLRGYSSVGRALQWHCKGRGFEFHYLHQFSSNTEL